MSKARKLEFDRGPDEDIAQQLLAVRPVEARRNIGMLGAEGLLPNRQRALVEWLGLRILPLRTIIFTCGDTTTRCRDG